MNSDPRFAGVTLPIFAATRMFVQAGQLKFVAISCDLTAEYSRLPPIRACQVPIAAGFRKVLEGLSGYGK